MGCINSKKDLLDINPNVFRVSNVDCDGTVLWSGQLEISRTELTLYRKDKKPTHWPLQCLRRYGFDTDLFSFEAGRRCDTGPGIYAFRCRRAENLFHTLQNYIQGRAYSTDETINSGDIIFPNSTSINGPSVAIRNNQFIAHTSLSRPNSGAGVSGGVHLGHNINTIGNNTVMYNHRSGVTTSQSLSPNGTIHSNSNQSRSSDTLTSDGNYLEPTPNRQQQLATRFSSGIRLSSVSSGPLSPDLGSPGSPSSITNILEVTTLNPLPNHSHHNQQYHGVSNVYQEFPLRENNNNNNNNLNNNNNNNNNNMNNTNNNINKKLTLDIPMQETTLPATSKSLQNNLTPMSPNIINNPQDLHSYMNVNLGDLQQQQQQTQIIPTMVSLPLTTSPTTSTTTSSTTTMSIINKTILNNYDDSPSTHLINSLTTSVTPTASSSTTSSTIFGFNRLNTYNSINETNRCYENLEPLLIRNKRYSKPDIFTKIDLPLDKSEPCTPTNTDRKVNYIVLDLDQTNLALSTASTVYSIINNCILNNNNPNTNNNLINNNINNNINNSNNNNAATTSSSSSTLSIIATTTITSTVLTANSLVTTPNSLLLPPESPKNASLGYATIDFNKTFALSKTTPSSELDSEGSRKTRHNSTMAPSPTKHSNSISD